MTVIEQELDTLGLPTPPKSPMTPGTEELLGEISRTFGNNRFSTYVVPREKDRGYTATATCLEGEWKGVKIPDMDWSQFQALERRHKVWWLGKTYRGNTWSLLRPAILQFRKEALRKVNKLELLMATLPDDL